MNGFPEYSRLRGSFNNSCISSKALHLSHRIYLCSLRFHSKRCHRISADGATALAVQPPSYASFHPCWSFQIKNRQVGHWQQAPSVTHYSLQRTAPFCLLKYSNLYLTFHPQFCRNIFFCRPLIGRANCRRPFTNYALSSLWYWSSQEHLQGSKLR